MMEVGREGHSGLYTMHFSNIFPLDTSAAAFTTPSSAAQTEDGATEPRQSASPMTQIPCSLTQFSQWHVLVRMNVQSELCFVKGEAKVFSPTPSLASASSRGIHKDGTAVVSATTPDNIPIVPIHQKDRKCSVVIEGAYHIPEETDTTSSTFQLDVHFDRLEGEVLGLSEPAELTDVVLSCGGCKACGWHLGVVSVTAGGKPVKMDQTLRFLLKPYYGKRCVNCLDPVYAIGYMCDACEMTHYCSRECLNAHMKRGHGLLCPILKDRYRFKSAVVTTEVSKNTGLVAWWRCLDHAYYTILVDVNNALGRAVEFTLCTLKSAKEEGLQYRFITPKLIVEGEDAGSGGRKVVTAALPAPTVEEVVDFARLLLCEVNRSAILEGCASLAAACLDHLFVFNPSAEITIQAHALFFTAFHCEEIDGPISTVEEYVSYARPLHCLAVAQIEHALKSPISTEFWRRIKVAKDVIIALFNVNACGPCVEVPEMRAVVARRQCETLTLLSRVFVMMAARAPPEEARRLLEQGEKCLRQCLTSESVTKDTYTHGIFCFHLSVLLLLFRDELKIEEARHLRAQGEKLLRSCPSWEQRQQSGMEVSEGRGTK